MSDVGFKIAEYLKYMRYLILKLLTSIFAITLFTSVSSANDLFNESMPCFSKFQPAIDRSIKVYYEENGLDYEALDLRLYYSSFENNVLTYSVEAFGEFSGSISFAPRCDQAVVSLPFGEYILWF